MIRYLVLLGLALSTTGCTSILGMDNIFRDRRSDYLRASEMPPINVPEDLDSQTLGAAYPVPSAGQVSEYQLASEFETPRPEQISIEQAGQVRIQRLGGDQWILVPAPPAEVWPQLRAFLAAQRIPTQSTDAANGVIESAWISDDGDDAMFYQYRFQLEQGVQLNTTEIVLDHREAPANTAEADLPAWDSGEGENAARANALRLRLAEALVETEGGSTASLLGQRIGAATKVEMVTPSEADPFLLLKLNYERSWASVEYALGTQSFAIRDSNKDGGQFDMVVRNLEAENYSWLRRQLRGTPESLGTPYRIQLRQVEGGVEVRVTNPDGSSLEQREAFNILTLLRSKLA